MDNYTPLKIAEKKKRKLNKFFIFGNIFLLAILVVLGGYMFRNQLFPSHQKATGPAGCPIPGYGTNCQPVSEGGACGNDQGAHCEGDQWCSPYRNELKCRNDNGTDYRWCCNGTDYTCKIVEGKCGVPFPPTATPAITNTPTPTATPPISPTPTTVENSPTPTVTSSPTPTATPIISSTPTSTPIISNTPTVTPSPGPSNTPQPGPSATPIPVLCGTKSCDNATNPCRSGYICIQANDGSNYCSSPDFVSACKASPTYNNCCTAPGTPSATPTQILLANVSPTAVAALLKTGTFSILYMIPGLVILAGLLL